MKMFIKIVYQVYENIKSKYYNINIYLIYNLKKCINISSKMCNQLRNITSKKKTVSRKKTSANWLALYGKDYILTDQK